jgi:hypothetical protein
MLPSNLEENGSVISDIYATFEQGASALKNLGASRIGRQI